MLKEGANMGFIFDIETGIFTLIVGHLICALLGIAYGIDNKGSHIDLKYLFARVIDITAWIIFTMVNHISSDSRVLISTSLFIIGGMIQAITLLQMKEKLRPKIWIIYISTCIILTGIHIEIYYFTSKNQHTVLVSLFLIVFLFWIYPIIILLEKETTSLQKMIALVYGLTFIAFFASIFSGQLKSCDSVNDSTILILYSLLLIRLFIINVGLILMSKEKMEQKIRYNASYDELTEIMNRRSFLLTAKNRIALNKKKQKPVVFLLMDLDDFKRINDSYGHHTGDLVLSDFSRRVREVIREGDVFGRIGGEEFTVLLTDTDCENGMKIAERIRSVIHKSLVNNEVSYTVSIGMVSLVCNDNTSYEELYTMSDKALYVAKEKGKNCIEHISLNEW